MANNANKSVRANEDTYYQNKAKASEETKKNNKQRERRKTDAGNLYECSGFECDIEDHE